ncbi:MAG: hypothetical protein KDB18_11760, partial [Salinibacterium sp.]|nr:hypothetical protein [Salinibacterium sp.]
GFLPREILVLFLGHVVVLALVGSLVGALLGALLPWGMAQLAPDLLPADLLVFWQPLAVLRGTTLGVVVAITFAASPLASVWQVSPARALRADADPLPTPRALRIATAAAVVVGVFGSAWWQSSSLRDAAAFTAGLAAVTGLLALSATGMRRLAGMIPRGRFVGPYLRSGLAALGRPGSGTTGAMVALGLGFLVVIAMGLIQSRLDGKLRNALPEDAPSVFLVDVQPDQWPGVELALKDQGARGIKSSPVIMARLAAINDVPVRELAKKRGKGRRGGWTMRREQRLTYYEDLPDDNRIVAGELWSDPEAFEVSLEQSFAERLGVELGDRLAFDVQGIPIELVVTSLRTVEWESFSMNFFLVAEPGVLDQAPGFRLATGRLDASREQALQDRLAREFPNVTVLRVRPIIERLLELMGRLALGIRVIGAFTVLAGLAILA